jgi:sulfide:quinone oxidoreductase
VVVANLLSAVESKKRQKNMMAIALALFLQNMGKLPLTEFDYDNKPKITYPFDPAKPR